MAHEDNQPDLVAQMDQMMANNENIAKIIADYYKVLRAEGTPVHVAKQLTLDFHNAFWEKSTTPTAEPMYDDDYQPTPTPNFFEKIIILLTVIFSALFFRQRKP